MKKNSQKAPSYKKEVFENEKSYLNHTYYTVNI